jgi:hypothetical protein
MGNTCCRRLPSVKEVGLKMGGAMAQRRSSMAQRGTIPNSNNNQPELLMRPRLPFWINLHLRMESFSQRIVSPVNVTEDHSQVAQSRTIVNGDGTEDHCGEQTNKQKSIGSPITLEFMSQM